ncbi:transglycosylase SLT domain-containing protein [Bacteroidales bacterium OttesenSCG-928-A17]|nr:transglycosylase SLT domain-containing protein [Bacteroidales bacterium OttesenSCG-928-A17]
MKAKISYFLFLLFLISVSGCKPKPSAEADYDFPQIKEKKEITALTLSGSMSYFFYKGEEMGYEYELLKHFAEVHNLSINLKVAPNVTRLQEILLEGEADLAAFNLPITNQGKEDLLYCGQEVLSEQVLIQKVMPDEPVLKGVAELIGKEIWVIHDSKYHRRLLNLNEELGGGIIIRIIEQDTISTEDLIAMVSAGEISYTLSDAELAKLNKTYFRNINTSLKVSHPQRSSWAVRKSMPLLAEKINQWFDENENTPRYRAITKRYFEMSKLPGETPAPLLAPGVISPFDDLFRKYASQIDWDWRLLASIAFQESKFYTDRISWAGAVGLMGLMPRTAEIFDVSPEEMYDPEGSIRGAVALIRRLNRSFRSIENEEERIKFILASYNAGSGHIYDAQALAEKYGKDPYVWKDNVEEFIKLKSLPEYYNDPVCKQGYFRGKETLNYVRHVIDRWRYYQREVEN